MRPAWDGITGWALLLLALLLLAWAAAGPGLDGRHVLAAVAASAGALLVRGAVAGGSDD